MLLPDYRLPDTCPAFHLVFIWGWWPVTITTGRFNLILTRLSLFPLKKEHIDVGQLAGGIGKAHILSVVYRRVVFVQPFQNEPCIIFAVCQYKPNPVVILCHPIQIPEVLFRQLTIVLRIDDFFQFRSFGVVIKATTAKSLMENNQVRIH